jgi:hypothetical protein
VPPQVSAALRHHRMRQKALRLAAGMAWEEHDLVFPNRMGRPMDELNLYKRPVPATPAAPEACRTPCYPPA